MYETWKKSIKSKLDKLHLTVLDLSDYGQGEGLCTKIDNNMILFFFYDNGIQVVTLFSDSCRVNRFNRDDCLEFVNLFNDDRRFMKLAIHENGFRVFYWHGIGQYSTVSDDVWTEMLSSSIGTFLNPDNDRYTLVDALKDVCDGSQTPRYAFDRLDC